jgi:hypothetical protein
MATVVRDFLHALIPFRPVQSNEQHKLKKANNQQLSLKLQNNPKEQTKKGSREKGETEGCVQGDEERQERGNRVLIWSSIKCAHR